jgi:hypothetical protein
MAQQTSVRHLVSKLFGEDYIITMSDEQLNILQESDQMHKQEIKTAFNNGNLYAYNSNKIQSAENYYNETFNK